MEAQLRELLQELQTSPYNFFTCYKKVATLMNEFIASDGKHEISHLNMYFFKPKKKKKNVELDKSELMYLCKNVIREPVAVSWTAIFRM